VEQIEDGRIMRSPNELLLYRGEVSSEELGAVRQHPGAPVRDLHAREYIRWILVELVLHGFAGIRSDRCDIDEARHTLVDSRGRDGGSAIGMTDEKDRTADAVKRPLHRRHILVERVQAILNRDHLVPVGLQGRDHLAEARAISPDAVAENDGWFGLRRHIALLACTE
jgi:hypothetical protein